MKIYAAISLPYIRFTALLPLRLNITFGKITYLHNLGLAEANWYDT